MFSNVKTFMQRAPVPVSELIPVVKYVNGCFEMRTGEYLNIFKITCKDLLNCSEDDVNLDIHTFEKFYKTVSADIKIVGMNLPTNTQLQQEYFKYKLNKTKNPVFQQFLKDKLDELELIEQTSTERQYYLFTFSSTLDLDADVYSRVMSVLGAQGLVETLSQREKEIVLYKYSNPANLIPDKRLLEREMEESRILFPKPENKKKVPPTLDEIIQEKHYNPFLLERIQPQGGISFASHESYIKTGDGYTACLLVHGCPKRSRWYWLCSILNINNAIVTIDIRTEDPERVKRNLNRSISEYNSRANSEKKAIDTIEAEHKLDRAIKMADEIMTMDEVIKSIVPRIFLTAPTVPELDSLVDSVRNYLRSNAYRSTVCINEAKNDYMSFFMSCTKQKEVGKEYFRLGLPFSSHVLAGGDPFIFSSLSDEFGAYFGDTNIAESKTINDGKVFFDAFYVDSDRMSYNAVITGLMGSGKSSTIKKILLDRAIRGDYVRGFDPTGEYSNLVEILGGKVLALDGSSGIINWFQVLKVAEEEEQCWNRHISKLSILYRFLKESATDQEISSFEEYVREMYVEMGIVPANNIFTDAQITGRRAEEYPTFSTFLRFLQKKRDQIAGMNVNANETVVINDEMLRLRAIESVIQNVVLNYGSILDGPTSIGDVLNTQILIFNIANLVKMKPEVCNAQLYNALSIFMDNSIRVGSPMKKAYDEGRIASEDVVRFLILVDEAHRLVNTQRLYAVDQLTNFSMEARKFFGALYLASPSLRRFVPENSSEAAVTKMKELFANMTYKFVFKQDASMIKAFREVFENQLNDEELRQIPYLDKGECILSMAGYKNIRFRVHLTDEEIDMFQGGA